MNSIVKGVNTYEEKSYLQTPPPINKPEMGGTVSPSIPPKKALGPKLIKVAVLLVLGVAILLVLPKKCKPDTQEKFQNTSTSGDSIKESSKSMPSQTFPSTKKKK